ncbi:MAG: DNA primase small subunit [Candidatus Korarchaeota archaeon]|nr:DNA primase small subunit [Candidatus Korarchaeota archaeon]NIU84602.1 hypothetical protein [Candidatus Thorarchaeota archaeon]NIW12744.1 hypothetical protein [Candidatus Thorarchaeota archaeon]NIW50952.1 hypothetical protein [Candidatus Korarchaeota archaeon]
MTGDFTKEIISAYYQRKFSLKPLLDVIGIEDFSYREFGFLLGKVEGHFVRNLSFRQPAELRSYLINKAPWAAYVGAAYEQRPTKKTPVTSLPLKKKELVFDIDLTDWNDLRTCGKEKDHYCKECWPFVRKAAKFIDETLQEDFGFEELHWFFSGRRGLHAWVLGERSQNLSKDAREAVIEYISPRKRGTLSKRFQFRAWNILCEGLKGGKGGSNLEKIYENLPRLDRKVTIDLHRLMRVPDSIHQATGRPVTTVENLETFYPDSVPFVWEILERG